MAYLDNLLYGYAICSLEDRYASDTLRFAANAVLEWFAAFGQIASRDANLGGGGGGLILQADLVLRTEMSRLNTLQPSLAGGEILASVLVSHAPHLPTQSAIAGAIKKMVSMPLRTKFTIREKERTQWAYFDYSRRESADVEISAETCAAISLLPLPPG